MMIDCPSCATAYHVTSAAVGRGRSVICPRCAARWFLPGTGAAAPVPVAATAARADRPVAQPAPAAAAANGSARRPTGRRGWRTAALVAGVAVLPSLAFAIHARRLPAFGAASPGADLALRNVVGTRTSDAEPATLAVRGTIANPRATEARVPDLALSIRDAGGAELYRWSAPPPVRRLAGGASAVFDVEVPRVPAAGHVVAVRFAEAAAR